MRIMGFSIDWPKLKQRQFTTFRFQRKDKDWQVGELVQVKVKPRSKGGGEHKGVAVIVGKASKDIIHDKKCITPVEAVEDGFPGGIPEMWRWLLKAHTPEQLVRPLNKLTLEWVK